MKRYTRKSSKEAEYLDGWKRCQADFDNFKRQAEQDLTQAEDKGKAEVLAKVLPVIDGLELVTKGLITSLGLTKVPTKTFDPEIHEATDGKGHKISQVVAKGYKLGQKLVRPAKVKLKE